MSYSLINHIVNCLDSVTVWVFAHICNSYLCRLCRGGRICRSNGSVGLSREWMECQAVLCRLWHYLHRVLTRRPIPTTQFLFPTFHTPIQSNATSHNQSSPGVGGWFLLLLLLKRLIKFARLHPPGDEMDGGEMGNWKACLLATWGTKEEE